MNSTLNNYFLLIFLGAVWGASFVAIKFCNLMFNPIEVGFFRTFIGALILLLAVLFRSGNLELFQKNSFTYAIIGLFNAAIPFTLIPYGLMSLPSNIGVIIMSANPFLALVLAHYFTEDEKLNLRKQRKEMLSEKKELQTIFSTRICLLGQTLDKSWTPGQPLDRSGQACPCLARCCLAARQIILAGSL